MKKIFTFFAALFMASNMMAAYYLVGTAAENGWSETKATLMENDEITRTLKAGTYEFKVLTTLGSWGGALGYGDVNAECSSKGYQNNGGNVKVTLAADGDLTVKIVDKKICVTGAFGEATITVYTIAGDEDLMGVKWDIKATANDMTNNNGTWTLVKKGLTLAAKDYEYKVLANHTWGVDDYPASGNNKITIAEAGNYEVTFTWIPADKSLTAVAKKEGTPGPGPDPEGDPATIRVRIDSSVDDWKFNEEGRGVYFYVWTIGAGTFNEATYEDGWYSYTNATTPFNFIVVNTNEWTSYASLQSVNMEDVTESACYLMKAGERIEGDGPSWNCVLEVADCNAPTAIESTTVKAAAKKIVENGQIVIIRDGVRFNIVGAQL